MKHLLIKFTAILTSMLCVFTSVDFNALAYELDSTFTVNFNIVNVCDYDGSGFTVVMDDIGSDLSKELEVSLGNGSTYTIPAPTTYQITIEGLKEGYKVLDYTTGETAEVSFAATNDGEKTFKWEIVSATDENVATQTEASDTSDEEASEEINNGGDDSINLDDPEGTYKEFLDTVSFIENDETWVNCIKIDAFEESGNIREEYLEEYYSTSVNHDNKTKEELMTEFRELSSYDKFLWDVTYLCLTEWIDLGKSENIHSYEKILNTSSIYTFATDYDPNKGDEVAAAYEKLMTWQVAYIEQTGGPYNFIDGCSYLESKGIEEIEINENKNSDSEDWEAAREEALEDLTPEERKEVEDAINEVKDEEDDSEKGNVAPIIIAVIVILLIGAGAFVFIKKKTKND